MWSIQDSQIRRGPAKIQPKLISFKISFKPIFTSFPLMIIAACAFCCDMCRKSWHILNSFMATECVETDMCFVMRYETRAHRTSHAFSIFWSETSSFRLFRFHLFSLLSPERALIVNAKTIGIGKMDYEVNVVRIHWKRLSLFPLLKDNRRKANFVLLLSSFHNCLFVQCAIRFRFSFTKRANKSGLWTKNALFISHRWRQGKMP